MKTKSKNYAVVFVTAPDSKTARAIVSKALEQRLIACGNILRGLQSLYWWQGKIEKSAEVLIIMKTTKSKLKLLQELVVANHPYETPEFIATDLIFGFEKYLNWIEESVLDV
ncbi:MAG: divalent-cation tolerance protein CutA [Verrucomicrobiia bacterium]